MSKIHVIGNNGFVGSSIMSKLSSRGMEVFGVNRNDIDLLSDETRKFFPKIVNDDDILVLAFAKAPAKNSDDLEINIKMLMNLIYGIKDKNIKYVLNISSDAVYGDSTYKLDENSIVEPQGYHGTMHCIREYLLQTNLKNCYVGHLRPTLIYGLNDPHNGYGPNSFLRKAKNNEHINLFGQGEELRDHIYIEDVAEIAFSMIINNTQGPVNAVSGQLISFNEIVQIIKKYSSTNVIVNHLERTSPMPHGGYRSFDPKLAMKIVENHNFTKLENYLKQNFE